MLKITPLPAQLRRKSDTHKGDYGHILIIGGSSGLTGAVCLSADSAMRAGAGLVTVGVPKSLSSIFEIKLTESMSLALGDNKGFLSLSAFGQIEKNLKKIDLILIGPGASANDQTRKLILKVIKEVDKPLVIDADAINALAGNLIVLKQAKSKQIVITPHLGEFSRLLKLDIKSVKKKRKELAKDFALRYNLSLVLKGHQSIVTDGKKLFINKIGNPGMATAGSGDVLAGIIAALLAQGLNGFEAAKLGVYVHAFAGDLAIKEIYKNCLIASDIIDFLPDAFEALSKSKK